ncbi:MAG TPA: NUDIX domain-containing protein [Cyclobacteriaceae bacterium]|nr:NUDIX domain-containing protein [Cyclobacteriaceae bacterium]
MNATPPLTVDCVVFGYSNTLKILLIKRDIKPFKGKWVLPGGFLQAETLEDAAHRILSSKVGLAKIYVEQLYTFGSLDRDPRGRVVSVAYYALVNPKNFSIVAGATSSDVHWFEIDELPELGFDHQAIINVAWQRLQSKVSYQPVGFNLLAEEFTLSELQFLYESILQRRIDKRNFRKKIMGSGILKETGKKRTGLKNRQPLLYSFDQKKYNKLLNEGFQFKL